MLGHPNFQKNIPADDTPLKKTIRLANKGVRSGQGKF